MTPKAERFVAEYLVDLNATQAAIRAGYSKRSAASQGERLLRNDEIRAEVRRRQQEVAETCGMTLASHLHTLQRLRDAAEGAEKFSAAVTAEIARGKAGGLYVEKVEVTAEVRGSVTYVAHLPRRT